MFRTKKRECRKHFSDYIVAAAITAVALYTAAAVTLQFCGFMEISSTLTTCWFSFWTVELVSLAAIKRGKVKQGEKKEAEDEKERKSKYYGNCL